EDEIVVKVRSVAGRKDLPDSLPKARYSGVAISRDKSTLYYSRQTPEGPRVFSHRIGSDATADAKLFGDGYGPEKIIGASLSEDGRYLLLPVFYGAAAPQTEVYFQDLESGGPIQTVVKDIPARFLPEIAGDRMFLQTNWDAPNGKVLVLPLASPSRESW